MKVDNVSFYDIARIHLKWKKTSYQANRVLAVMASMHSFAAKRKFIPSGFNPAHGLEKYAEKGHERFLSIEELEHLGAAIREAESVGFAWAVDDSKPSSKHAPKGEPPDDDWATCRWCASALALHGLPTSGNSSLEVGARRFRARPAFPPESKTGKKRVF